MQDFQQRSPRTLRVIETFSGVGGIRRGLQGVGTPEHPSNGAFKVVFSNQFEPSTKTQHASDVYEARWGSEGHTNVDIFQVVNDPMQMAALAQLRPEVLAGGFPCQDYSVAQSSAAGIEGKKGVLWWALHSMLSQMADTGHPVKYLMLENVDRLLKSPTKCRGRDFAIILASLARLGYAVEWRIVNAAEQGHAQSRKRVFIVGYHRSTEAYQALVSSQASGAAQWLDTHGTMARAFPVEPLGTGPIAPFHVGDDMLQVQADFAPTAKGNSPFRNAGVMVDGKVWTADVKPLARPASASGGDTPRTLGDVVARTGAVDESFYLDEADLPRWKYLKGAKREPRVTEGGFAYTYTEGAMAFPDALDRPSRTIITGEGGSSASRTKHVIRAADGRLRRLTPEELEELNGFPRGFTRLAGVSDVKRAFLMGNALVVGLVQEMGVALHAVVDAAEHAVS